MPSKRIKMRQEKRKKRGGEKEEILLSAHVQTLQANILHLDQKAAKCMTCKQLGGKF